MNKAFKTLNYIEDHLSENMKIDTLANVAVLSPYYFQRLFGRLVKKPVNEYVRLRRLAKASEALKSKEKRIVDVALDYGFADHASFTHAFKDAYGITPDEFRTCPVILNQFIKPDLLLNYVVVDEDVPLIADGIVVEVTRRKLDEKAQSGLRQFRCRDVLWYEPGCKLYGAMAAIKLITKDTENKENMG